MGCGGKLHSKSAKLAARAGLVYWELNFAE